MHRMQMAAELHHIHLVARRSYLSNCLNGYKLLLCLCLTGITPQAGEHRHVDTKAKDNMSNGEAKTQVKKYVFDVHPCRSKNANMCCLIFLEGGFGFCCGTYRCLHLICRSFTTIINKIRLNGYYEVFAFINPLRMMLLSYLKGNKNATYIHVQWWVFTLTKVEVNSFHFY